MCDCDCLMPEFYEESHPVARREHRCCECRRPIPKGAKYRRIAGKWDGEFDTFSQCARCERVSKRLHSLDVCVCFGQLRDALHEFNRTCRMEERSRV